MYDVLIAIFQLGKDICNEEKFLIYVMKKTFLHP